MSTGTNQERIEQNNTKLADLKTEVINLPEHQDLYPIYNNTADSTYINILKQNVTTAYWVDNYVGTLSGERPWYHTLYKIDGTNVTRLWQGTINPYQVSPARSFKLIAHVNDCLYGYRGDGNYNTYYNIWKFDLKTNTMTLNYWTLSFSFETSYEIFRGLDGQFYTTKSLYGPTYKLDIDFEAKTCKNTSLFSLGFWMNTYFRGVNSAILDNKVGYINEKKVVTYSGSTVVNLITPLNTKIILDGKLYYLNADLTKGAQISEFSLPSSFSSSDLFWQVKDNLYYNSTKRAYCLWYEDTNSLDIIATNFTGNYSYDVCASNIKNSSNYNCNMQTGVSDNIVGYKINDKLYYSNDDRVVNADYLVSGKVLYSRDGSQVIGTMLNNGTLHYTPIKSQQTIPKGYTDGGIISAVTSDVDNNIIPSNIKKDINILGVVGTYEVPDIDAIEQELDILNNESTGLKLRDIVDGEKVTELYLPKTVVFNEDIDLDVSRFIRLNDTYGMGPFEEVADITYRGYGIGSEWGGPIDWVTLDNRTFTVHNLYEGYFDGTDIFDTLEDLGDYYKMTFTRELTLTVPEFADVSTIPVLGKFFQVLDE